MAYRLSSACASSHWRIEKHQHVVWSSFWRLGRTSVVGNRSRLCACLLRPTFVQHLSGTHLGIGEGLQDGLRETHAMHSQVGCLPDEKVDQFILLDPNVGWAIQDVEGVEGVLFEPLVQNVTTIE